MRIASAKKDSTDSLHDPFFVSNIFLTLLKLIEMLICVTNFFELE